jgi:hypothetical protein
MMPAWRTWTTIDPSEALGRRELGEQLVPLLARLEGLLRQPLEEDLRVRLVAKLG